MQFSALIASLFLHLLFILLSISFTGISRHMPIDLDRQVHMVELVYLSEPEPAPAPREIPAARPPEPPRTQPVPEPEPKVEIAEKPRPEPKPEPEPEPKTRPEPKPEPKPEPPKPRTPTPEERLASELAALREDVARSTKGQAPREQAGLLEVYAAIAEEYIKRNWRFPRIGGDQNLVVRVEVNIDSTGRIVHSRILRTSGREDFDHSALRAVEDTRQLPEPPSAAIRILVIDFNLHDLS